jgi:hypothetical protein
MRGVQGPERTVARQPQQPRNPAQPGRRKATKARSRRFFNGVNRWGLAVWFVEGVVHSNGKGPVSTPEDISAKWPLYRQDAIHSRWRAHFTIFPLLFSLLALEPNSTRNGNLDERKEKKRRHLKGGILSTHESVKCLFVWKRQLNSLQVNRC